MTDGETVYRPPAGHSSPAIHRDLECENLNRYRAITGKEPSEKPLSVFPDYVPRCSLCFDGGDADE